MYPILLIGPPEVSVVVFSHFFLAVHLGTILFGDFKVLRFSSSKDQQENLAASEISEGLIHYFAAKKLFLNASEITLLTSYLKKMDLFFVEV